MGSVAYIMESKVKHLFVLNPAAGKHDSSGELHQLIDELGSARGLDFRLSLIHIEMCIRDRA